MQDVSDYGFVDLITDIIYILATLGAPPQLSAIVAHDYGTLSSSHMCRAWCRIAMQHVFASVCLSTQ